MKKVQNNKNLQRKSGKKPQIKEAVLTQIFLVDDDRLVLATLKQGLVDKGYEVRDFSNPELALSAYRESPPDLILLDMRMPEMSGTDLAREMMAILVRPIIMLSAYDDREIVREAVRLGVSGYLVKPVMPNQLVPTIEATLTRFSEISALLDNSDQLRDGLEKNRVISTAIGITMERQRLSADMAFQQLRGLARSQSRPLRDIASDLVEATSQVNYLTR